ncbi:MAG: DUF4276 family protein [Saprospiraceae bacterium]|nr:DUF4276 family protein [Saprospiraceae bacterium]
MVKLGFIAEGDTEKRVLTSENFKELLKRLGLSFLENVENAGGVSNLRKEKIKSLIQIQKDRGAEKVLILTDSDGKCITSAKQEIDPAGENIVIVAVQMIEAWFLADSAAMSIFLKGKYFCPSPEAIPNPFETIKEERKERLGSGVGDKRTLGQKIHYSGFSLEAAAAHPNCPSAKYFLDKLTALSSL